MSENQKYAIELNGVAKYFDLPQEKTNTLKQLIIHPTRLFKRKLTRQTALEDISFKVEEGEFFGIVGKNGSGKSTLLKILAGIYQPNEGHVDVRGSIMPFIELGVGFNPELTGRENVFLSGALFGFSKEEMEERYKAIVQFAEIEDFMDQKLKNYSSGMQVRLAFSIATQVNTDIFLIDEVLAVGDTEFQRKCYDYFKKLKRDKKTVVFITHEMDAVRQYCDRAMLISDSRIKEIGSVEEITKQYDKLNQRKSLSEAEAESRSERWGDGMGVVEHVASAQDIYQDDETVEIHTDFKVVEDIDQATIGIGIFDQQGRPITGTNTDLLKAPLGDIKAGEKRKIVWEIDQVFNDGEYEINVELKHSGGISDSWPAASRFAVARTNKTGFLISPEYRINIDGKQVAHKKTNKQVTEQKVVQQAAAAHPARVVPASNETASTTTAAEVIGEPGIINALQILDGSLKRFLHKIHRGVKNRQYKPNRQVYEVKNDSPAHMLALAKQRDFSDFKPHKLYKRWVVVGWLVGFVAWSYKTVIRILGKLARFILRRLK